VRVAAPLPAMSEGNVQLDHEVAVARCVHRAVRGVAALDDPRKGQGGELALGEALVDAGPDGRALSGVLANGERMQETQPPRIRDALVKRLRSHSASIATSAPPSATPR